LISYACCSARSHTPAGWNSALTAAYVSMRQHASAYVSIRQHTSAYVSIRQHTSAYVSMHQHASAYVSIRQHTSACVSMRAAPLAHTRPKAGRAHSRSSRVSICTFVLVK
jgi:hypothetical protein